MFDIVVLALLALIFLYLLNRWRGAQDRSPLPVMVSGALLAGFAAWWYLLGPLVAG